MDILAGLAELWSSASTLRIVMAGGGYHVLNQGNRPDPTVRADADRRRA